MLCITVLVSVTDAQSVSAVHNINTYIRVSISAVHNSISAPQSSNTTITHSCTPDSSLMRHQPSNTLSDSNPTRKAAVRHLSELVISQYHREHGTACKRFLSFSSSVSLEVPPDSSLMRHQPSNTLSPSLGRCPSLAMGRVSDGHDMDGTSPPLHRCTPDASRDSWPRL